MSIQLIENWRDWPRMYSMWAFATIATLQGSILAFIPTEQLAAPILFWPALTWGGAFQALVAFLAITGGIGRLVAQPVPA